MGDENYPVDPRVQWAMDVMDQEGINFEADWEKLIVPVNLAAMFPAAVGLNNLITRRPIKTNMLFAVAAAPFMFGLGVKLREWRSNVNKENMALMKHYILTHPERFPEPKRSKFIDVIKPWNAYRT
eukprot:TRINITY_DN16338_c0_g1_i1.p1 TRINITY_DN16338_c0_g1~~TRINITY_DN16338_c0_g1_i1.p1  ORF type:complete len:126 (+),score=22.83 TRINITY_DN16338_c0_g1_i1:28-405(+)